MQVDQIQTYSSHRTGHEVLRARCTFRGKLPSSSCTFSSCELCLLDSPSSGKLQTVLASFPSRWVLGILGAVRLSRGVLLSLRSQVPAPRMWSNSPPFAGYREQLVSIRVGSWREVLSLRSVEVKGGTFEVSLHWRNRTSHSWIKLQV